MKSSLIKISTLLSWLILSFGLSAKTLIISDIDDTIKRTNVLGKRVLINGAKTTNPFYGLNELYNALVCHDLTGSKYSDCVSGQGMGSSNEIALYYVTGAPGILQTFGRRFVKNSGFPIRNVYGKDGFGVDTKTFKLRKISEIIETTADISKVILIGDNGEYDAEVYNEIVEQYPEFEFTTYIHALYNINEAEMKIFDEIGKPLFPGQIPYLTAVDLGIDLLAKELIKKSAFNKVFSQALVISQSRDEDIFKQLIPEWMGCTYFQDIYHQPSAPLTLAQRFLLKQFNSNVDFLCAYED